nr:histone-lysine N-methyltransferase trithorax [Onthophagus taurus]
MGRSKFPGKPSKHVNRTRINVLCTPLQTTTVGDSNNVVTVDTNESEKEVIQQPELSTDDQREIEEDESIPRRKRAKLLKKRAAALKRNGMLQGKLSGQVSRRTRSAVTNRRNMCGFSSIRGKVSKTKLSETSTFGTVGKFVLPSRSVHSSRVIKPNKRFINVESNEARAFKKRVNKRLRVREEDVGEGEKEENDIEDNEEEAKENEVLPAKQNAKGKVVLRQARLQLHTENMSMEGPFSCNSTNSLSSPPGTVTCGVCGAVRFYRFVKQARKFNIYSCESCRKFISKMIKRQNNLNSTNSSILVCHNGQGMCHVPPIVRSQQWKLFRCAYRARCPACWLKMCLKSFQMPAGLRNSLAQLLPKNMQTYDILFTNSFSWQSSSTNSADVQSTSAVDKISIVANKDDEEDLAVRRRPIRQSALKRDTTKPPTIPTQPEIKRQKIDLKGPRVKHVCRSASIVLGHPIATFPLDTKKTELDEKPDTKKIEREPKTLFREDSDDTSQSSGSIRSKNDMKSDLAKVRNNKTFITTSNNNNVAPEVKPVSYIKKNLICRRNTIAIDFWENYDPDEICRNGFGLMASEMFPMRAICFLCGSAGQETLLHCLICCEPYHPYCLEQVPANFPVDGKHDWLCPRCTTCHACGLADRQKINCLKCHKAYHPNCFNSMWKRDDRPTVCSNCLRCKSCGTENIKKFVGNIALCHVCFKLRNKGNFCPLCQKCYDDNDFETNMMECAKCKKWVHANCESLAEEQYQILSLLPESVEFFCRLCSNQSTPYWKEAICNELKASFNHVLRLLSKNRQARNMLKLSPYKVMNVTGRTPMAVRKLQFREDDIDINDNKELSKESQDEDNLKQESKTPVSPTMVDIKNKLNSNEYVSLQEFNAGMEHALEAADSELLTIYRSVLKEVFPWYNPTDKLKEENVQTTTNNVPLQSSLNTPKRYKFDNKDKDDKVDNRTCGLCKIIGDGLPDHEGRLLYCGQNEWVHANCALWSSEVYEEIDGSLQNIHGALSRGRLIKCAACKQKGASVGCCEKGCHETYHFVCALNSNCHFLHDKTVYCSTHDVKNKQNLLTCSTDFDIRRSVYVEIDRKRKKFCEPDKIHFMVGSLSVTNLGKIIPLLSDDFDALVPLGFVCSRLFWSTMEPWKLVPYNITTTILNSQVNSVYIDKNFTVDHSLSKNDVEEKFKEIVTWQKDLSKDNAESEYEEEQQATDLFSPEITDEIFADFPQDLLDGFSEQDMMMYDDLLNMEFKSDMNLNDNIINPDKKDFSEEDSDSKTSRELKRSKSEVFNQFGNKNRSHQRSCSLTLSCKLDNSLTPAIKKRKINPRDNMFFQLLQVDGACDSSGSECGSPIHETEHMWTCESSEEPVTCERCQCTYRTRASYKRHLEACDALSTSESDSEEHHNNENLIITQDVINSTQPNVITSFESFSSFQTTQNEVHSTILNTQTVVTEATSEVITVPENANVIYPTFQQQVVEHKSNVPTITHEGITLNGLIQNTETLEEHSQTNSNITINQTQMSTTQPSFCINQQPICMNQSNLSLNHGLISLDSNSIPITINQSGSISLNQNSLPVEIQQPVTIQSLPFTTPEVATPILNITPQNQITIDAKMLPCSNIVNSVVAQTVTVPQNQLFKSLIKPTIVAQKSIRPRAKPRNLAAKTNRLPTGSTIIMPQTSQSAPVIVQHLPTSNMVPFVDAFQQQSGQNVQYVATIAPQPHLVQIQPENNFLSLVNGVQPTMIIQQPRVVADQLIVDGNGSMVWATQPVQPVYYGFETIVHNTVMQSQQYLPTTMPGVLTTNSSYSATTQVFQTSKLEPVIDVGQGGFVLVNSGQTVNPTIQMPLQISQNQISQNQISQNQISQNQISQNQISQNQISVPQHVQTSRIEPKVQQYTIEPQRTDVQASQYIHRPQPKPQIPQINNQHCITLPVAPFVPEQGIPTNIVTPTPKPPTTTQSRPMSRVLPMQTNASREQKKLPIVEEKPVEIIKENILANFKPKITLVENIVIKDDNRIVPKIEKSERNEKVDPIKLTPPVKIEKIKSIPLVLKDVIEAKKEKQLEIKNFQNQKLAPKPSVTKSMPQLVDTVNIKNMSQKLDIFKTVSQQVNPKSIQTIEKDPKEIVPSPLQEAKIDISSPLDITKFDVPKTFSDPLNITKNSVDTNKPDPTFKITILEKENVPTIVPNDIKELQPSIQVTIKPPKSEDKSMPLLEITDEKLEPPLESNIILPKQPKIAEKPVIIEKPIIEKSIIEKPTSTASKTTNNGTAILYTVETKDGFRYSSTSLYELWSKVFDAVQSARTAHNMSPLPANALDMINNLQLLGLKTNGLRYLLEQLPGASKCTKYKPSFHVRASTDDSDDDIEIGSSSGAARTVPYARKKDHTDMFGWLASKHRKPEHYVKDTDLLPRRGSVTNLPMAMRFRQLKLTSKKSVGVYRSNIHRRGLFSLRDFESGEMVIEYAGEVIRSILTDKREKSYNAKGIGCYMFRVDDNLVVDATMKGNAARFINHSCDPNCYSKVVEIHGHKHIIIFALRRICYGEELTYDYKFPFEEDKIPCTCGARRCRKFLN